MGTNVSNAYASEEWAGESETQGSLCYLRPCFKNKVIKTATAFSQFYLTDPVWLQATNLYKREGNTAEG